MNQSSVQTKGSVLSVDQEFTNSLLCPVCLDFYNLPIFLCDNGHSICSGCAQRSAKCPTCRANINKKLRNQILEQQLYTIDYQCQFEGCSEKIKLSSKKQHEDICPFNPNLKCLLNCKNFVGTRNQLIEHIQKQHAVPQYDIFGSEAEFSSRLRPETSAPLSGCVKLLHIFHKNISQSIQPSTNQAPILSFTETEYSTLAQSQNIKTSEQYSIFTYLYMDANRNLLYPQLRTFSTQKLCYSFKVWNIEDESIGWLKIKGIALDVAKSLEEERNSKSCIVIDLESIVNKFAFQDRVEKNDNTRLLHFKIKILPQCS